MGRAELSGAKIQRAFADDPSGKKFEEFFRLLLEAERSLRHVVGTTTIDGPTKSGKADGGKDLSVEVGEAPKIARASFGEPLTWDEGRTFYSLKAGTKWRESVFEDVGYGGHLTGRKQEKGKEPKPPKGRDLLEHVIHGNRYVIVVCEPTDGGNDVLTKARAALAFHMNSATLTPPVGWESKIQFIDANDLASFIRLNQPILPHELDRKLELDWPRELDRFDQWTRRFGRQISEYVADPEREDLLERLPGAASNIVRIFGPPGVGKTRLVHRALEQLDERARELDPDQVSRPTDAVYYTDTFSIARDVLFGPWIAGEAGAITLVVDEVTSADAEALAHNFIARVPAERRARLILIGVSDEDAREGLNHQGDVQGIALGILGPNAARTLVELQVGSSNAARVNQILDLAEGYPYFAILLAEALQEDDDALESGTDHANRWNAAKRVLAGSRAYFGGNEQTWVDEATRRALCLLVVIMTGDQDLDWDALWADLGDDLRIVIAETCDWKAVKSADAACFDRGLLRRVGSSNKRYVSPANLARMILNHFFGEGPTDLGPRLLRCGPRLQDRIHAMAKRLGATRRVRDKLSHGLLAEFARRRVDGESIVELIHAPNALSIAAERFPDDTATVLSAAILQYDRAALLAQDRLRHGLRGMMETLVQDQVSPSAFGRLEAALFAMASVDDERWANNATGIWRSLFLVALSQTHQPWRVRFELLARRCREGTSEERVLAISGLALTVSADERGLGHAPGREWPTPSDADYHSRKREAWVLLLDLCGDDDELVAGSAREVVAGKLRGCIRDDVAVDAALLRELGEGVEGWTSTQRGKLAETLAGIRRHDYAELDDEVRGAIDDLDQSLRPSDFVERLVRQVGSWHPGPWPINQTHREELEAHDDEALVGEALVDPAHLGTQWAWLASSAALRRRPFLRTLGRLDRTRRFLPELEALDGPTLPRHTQLLAWYVEGWSQIAHDDVDAWLACQVAGGPHEHVAAFVLPFLEPSDRRLEWLLEGMARGRADGTALLALRHRWVAATSASLMLRLIDACAERPESIAVAVDLVVELLHLELDAGLRERALDLATSALIGVTNQRVPASSEHDWHSLLSKLIQSGRSDAAIDATLSLIASRQNIGMTQLIDRSLHTIFEQGQAQQLWQGAADRLEGEDAETIAWHLGHAGALTWIPVTDILAWVAGSESRGMTAMSLVNPYGEALPDLAVELLRRFGETGPVAAALTARARTTPRAINSLLDFKRRQLANVEHWAKHEVDEVRRWAERLALLLRQAIAEDEAHETFRRKLG